MEKKSLDIHYEFFLILSHLIFYRENKYYVERAEGVYLVLLLLAGEVLLTT